MRDWWFDICAERFGARSSKQAELSELSKDIKAVLEQNSQLITSLLHKPESSRRPTRPITLPNSLAPEITFIPKLFDAFVTVDGVNDPGAFALRVEGESMAPRISAGDLIVVSPKADVLDGDICVVRHNGVDMVRVVKFEGDFLILIPLNPKHEPWTIKITDTTFIWKVVKVLATL